MTSDRSILDQLTSSEHATIRYKTRLNILDEDPTSHEMLRLQSQIKSSPITRNLLSRRDQDGTMRSHPYEKWSGAHWTLTDLADIYYPQHDKSLLPLRAQEYEWLFSDTHLATAPFTKPRAGRDFGGERPRIHASMEGNAIFSLVRLGLNDERTEHLVERLLKTQWPDGGWNCDQRPQANPTISSFHETITPLRALALHAQRTKSVKSREASKKAAEIFLKRKMFRRQSDDKIMETAFTKLHYPPYWHYDILFGLKVVAEAGFVKDPRCEEALDLLESKRLKNGGFPAEAKYYHTQQKRRSGLSLVDWGGVSSTRMNEFVTLDALYVLKAADRF